MDLCSTRMEAAVQHGAAYASSWAASLESLHLAAGGLLLWLLLLLLLELLVADELLVGVLAVDTEAGGVAVAVVLEDAVKGAVDVVTSRCGSCPSAT